MHVQGKGVLADIYRTLINKFDPSSAASAADADEAGITSCIPHPSAPNLWMYKVIGKSILSLCTESLNVLN